MDTLSGEATIFIFIVVSHLIRGKLLNKRICKFFPLKADPILKGLHYPGQQKQSHKSHFQSYTVELQWLEH